MTAQHTRTGGKFLSLDRSQPQPRAMSEDARRAGQHLATAQRFPLVDFLSERSLLALLRWMRCEGRA